MDTFIARQPIFDKSLAVYGYELLHRSNAEDGFECADPDRATVELLDSSLLLHQLDELTDGKLGFVNVPRNLLGLDFLRLLPADQTVIEVLETVRPEPFVLDALARLKQAGYRIALDDFVDDPAYAPMIPLADIIKVDWLATTRAKRREIVERHRGGERRFLAEKVETRAQYEEALGAGYDLFQGYFFCRPEVSTRRKLPSCKLNYLRFLREVSREDLSLERLGEIIRGELSLAARLLRYLNSAHFGVRGEIQSIRHALVYLGDRPIRRWGTLVALAGLGDDKPLELVRTCLVRARFCEQVAERIGTSDSALDLYMTGLFSAIDALLDLPLDEALTEVGLSPRIRSAILGDESTLSRAVALALACEQGDFAAFSRHAAALGLAPRGLADLYAEAMFWADSVFSAESGERAA